MAHNPMADRIRAEYLEMPGLRLTLEQTQRFCGLERAECEAALEALVAAEFLCLKSDGTYARLTDGALPRPLPARAELAVHALQRDGQRARELKARRA